MIPEAVQRTRRLLEDWAVPHELSRNPPVVSCRDAAAVRLLNGRRGIPLDHELHSRVLALRPRALRTFALVHFAAHRRLDDEAVRVALDLPSRPRGASARDLLGLGFTRGTVNPFAHLNTGSVVHVFDADSLAATHADDPGMMTNAGEQTWAVRFSLRRFADAAVEHSGGRAWIVPGLAPEPALSSSMS